MISKQVIAGAVNSIINYLGDDYMTFTSRSASGTYYLNGTLLSGVASVSNSQAFATTQIVTFDETNFIVDSGFQVYFKVAQYQSSSTTRPTRV